MVDFTNILKDQQSIDDLTLSLKYFKKKSIR